MTFNAITYLLWKKSSKLVKNLLDPAEHLKFSVLENSLIHLKMKMKMKMIQGALRRAYFDLFYNTNTYISEIKKVTRNIL